jgi:hypothetical protein
VFAKHVLYSALFRNEFEKEFDRSARRCIIQEALNLSCERKEPVSIRTRTIQPRADLSNELLLLRLHDTCPDSQHTMEQIVNGLQRLRSNEGGSQLLCERSLIGQPHARRDHQ